MVGKKWRKAAAVGIAGVLAVGVLAGCGNSSGTGSNGKMKIRSCTNCTASGT